MIYQNLKVAQSKKGNVANHFNIYKIYSKLFKNKSKLHEKQTIKTLVKKMTKDRVVNPFNVKKQNISLCRIK